ncbi:MAG: hypothetical protein NTV32_06005 [Gammaproteobacteria bacterium]|nr:hypothetical protein [Gammaproteobacteria bacterium]
MPNLKKIAISCIFACSPLAVFASTPPACNEQTQVCNVQALIEENSVGFSVLQNAITITPDLQQLHLRISGPQAAPPYNSESSGFATTLALIQQIRAIAPNLQLGFHPDNNSSDSYGAWGCSQGDHVCVFSNSIAYMNAINNALPKGTVGFNIFSIEQSYVEEAIIIKGVDVPAQEKLCLQGQVIPGVCTVAANPAVAYANVAGNPYASDLLNSTHYDYAYPQMYNLSKGNWFWSPSSVQIIDPDMLPPKYPQYTLLDAYNGSTVFTNPFVPMQLTTHPSVTSGTCSISSIYQEGIFDPGNNLPPISMSQHAGYAAQILATLITSRFPPSAPHYPEPSPYPFGVPNNAQGQSMEYFTLSGESQGTSGNCFLGSSGWDIATLNAFFDDYRTDLVSLGITTADASSAPFAIWSFDTMPIYNPPSSSSKSSLNTKTPVEGPSDTNSSDPNLVTFHDF